MALRPPSTVRTRADQPISGTPPNTVLLSEPWSVGSAIRQAGGARPDIAARKSNAIKRHPDQ